MTDEEQSTIVNALHRNKLDSQLDIEYLDYRHYPFGFPREELVSLFRKKFQGRKIDLLIALNEPALNFAIKHHSEIFGHAPIVFLGINNFNSAKLANDKRVTGVSSTVDPAGSIEVMLRLHPHTKEILILHDYTTGGLSVRREFEAALSGFSKQVRFRFNDNLTVAEIAEELERLSQGDLVLLLSYANDKTAKSFDIVELTKLFSQHSPVPIYGHAEIRLGHGIVGGKLLSPNVVAMEAYKLVTRIFRGEDVGNIPVVAKSTARYMFDYQQMERFHIPLSSLPLDSIVINRPVPFYTTHRNVILTAAAIIVFLFLIISVLIINITQRRKSALMLRESEAKYSDLYGNAPDMYYSIDAKTGTIKECNETFLCVTGYNREEILGRSIFELFTPDCVEDAKKSFQRFAVIGEAQAERKVMCKDGRIIDVSVKASSIKDKGGNVLYSRSVWRDITERKRAEEALRLSEERFRKVFEISPIGIVFVGFDGRFLQVNPAFCNIAGYEEEEILGKTFQEITYKDDLEADLAHFKQLQNDEISQFTMEKRYIHKEGHILSVLLCATTIHNNRGNPLCYLGEVMDITGRKRAAEKIQQQREELSQVSRLATIGEFATSIAHEINQPLTAILNNAQAAQRFLSHDTPDIDEVRDIITDIIDDNKRASEVIRHLRSFLKRQDIEKTDLNINLVIQDVMALLNFEIANNNVSVNLDLSPDIRPVRGDHIALQQVLMNLILNACDAMSDAEPDQRRLFIRTVSNESDNVLVAVQDSGLGLDKKTLEHIFEPFFTTKSEGLGMGLSISKTIIAAHGGRIWAVNNPGSGATFCFTLPIYLGKTS